MAGIPEGGFIKAEELERWLESLPEERRLRFARILSSRSALRVLPLVYVVARRHASASRGILLTAALRASATSRIAGIASGEELTIAAEAASDFAASAADSMSTHLKLNDLDAAAAGAATRAGAAAARTVAAARVADAASDSISRAASATGDIESVWGELTEDARSLNAGKDVFGAPLWSTSVPKWSSKYWEWMRKDILERNKGYWRIWLDWYQSMLDGQPAWNLPPELDEEVSVRIALGDNRPDFWDRDHGKINAEIAGWVENARMRARLIAFQKNAPGNHWVQRGAVLVIANEASSDDEAVAQEPVTIKAHASLMRKAAELQAASRSFTDLYGWKDFDGRMDALAEVLNCPQAQLAANIWEIYDRSLTVASFLQEDIDRRRDSPTRANATLSPEHRRIFVEFVRSIAPWVRRFPSIREEDENASNYLHRFSEHLALALANSAQAHGVITEKDRALIEALLAAMEQKGLPAEKAGIRGHFTVRNLVFMAAAVVGPIFLEGAFQKTEIYDPVTKWMADRFDEVTDIIADAPDDIRVIVEGILDEIRDRDQHNDDRDQPLDEGPRSRR